MQKPKSLVETLEKENSNGQVEQTAVEQPWEDLPTKKKPTNSSSILNSLLKSANEAITYGTIDDGVYDAVTKSMKFRTIKNGSRLIEIIYDTWDSNKKHQTATHTEWLPDNFLQDDIELDNSSLMRKRIIINKMLEFLWKVRPEEKDVVKEYFISQLADFLETGIDKDLTSYIKGKEGQLEVVTKTSISKKDNKQYQNQNLIFHTKKKINLVF